MPEKGMMKADGRPELTFRLRIPLETLETLLLGKVLAHLAGIFLVPGQLAADMMMHLRGYHGEVRFEVRLRAGEGFVRGPEEEREEEDGEEGVGDVVHLVSVRCQETSNTKEAESMQSKVTRSRSFSSSSIKS
jgi:hypothetical protein